MFEELCRTSAISCLLNCRKVVVISRLIYSYILFISPNHYRHLSSAFNYTLTYINTQMNAHVHTSIHTYTCILPRDHTCTTKKTN